MVEKVNEALKSAYINRDYKQHKSQKDMALDQAVDLIDDIGNFEKNFSDPTLLLSFIKLSSKHRLIITDDFSTLTNISLKKHTLLSPLDYANICSFSDKIFDREMKQWALKKIKVKTLTAYEVIQVWNLTENIPV